MKAHFSRRRLPFLATLVFLGTLAAALGPAPFSAPAALAQSDVRIIIYAGNPVTEGEEASFTVAAVTGTGQPAALNSALTVNLSVSEAAGSDFVAAANEGSKTVVIPAGQAGECNANYTVATVDDSTDELNGSVTVTVKSGSGYTLGPADSITASVSVADNDNEPPPPPADTTAPTLQSATVDGSTLTLTFNEALKATSIPGLSRFDVTGLDRTTAIGGVAFKSGDATKVELTLFPAVANDDTGLQVSYAKGSDANPLQDAAGNLVANFAEPVTNLNVGPIISIGGGQPVTEGTAASFTVRASTALRAHCGILSVAIQDIGGHAEGASRGDVIEIVGRALGRKFGIVQLEISELRRGVLGGPCQFHPLGKAHPPGRPNPDQRVAAPGPIRRQRAGKGV